MPGLLNEYFTRAAIHEHSRENRQKEMIVNVPLNWHAASVWVDWRLQLAFIPFLSDAQNVRWTEEKKSLNGLEGIGSIVCFFCLSMIAFLSLGGRGTKGVVRSLYIDVNGFAAIYICGLRLNFDWFEDVRGFGTRVSAIMLSALRFFSGRSRATVPNEFIKNAIKRSHYQNWSRELL